ncbi:hypothetical protein ACL6C3_15420 [Capilliphycus salinus ALCB114379]|uniref:hypothetical protein n=1 Tax=Capilliphycus salinus TaxID=2768948 RepID=UPI0039A597B6
MKNPPKPRTCLKFMGLLFSCSLFFNLVFPLLAQNSSPLPWHRFFENSEPPTEPQGNPGDGGSRGDDICPIAPNNLAVLKVWNIRPTLTWSGEITKLEIRELDSRTNLWNQRISDNNKVPSLSSDELKLYQITVETDLQPGQTYKWYFSDKPDGEYDEYLPVEFTIMTDRERESIAQELQQLEQELTAQNITGDGAKLRRADYFASQNLWLDFWQEVLSVESPSEDLKALLTSTIGELCE